MHQALQFAVPNVECIFGQRDDGLCGNFPGNEQVIEPEQNAEMKRCHVDENEEDTGGVRKAAIVNHCPRRQVHAGGEAQAESNSKNLARPFEMEIGSEKEDSYQDAALDDVGGLLQEIGAVDDRDGITLWGVGSRQNTGKQ